MASISLKMPGLSPRRAILIHASISAMRSRRVTSFSQVARSEAGPFRICASAFRIPLFGECPATQSVRSSQPVGNTLLRTELDQAFGNVLCLKMLGRRKSNWAQGKRLGQVCRSLGDCIIQLTLLDAKSKAL